MIRKAYDYIIVGGGPAGCVLAYRLSANPATRVLLLEAGSARSSLGVRFVDCRLCVPRLDAL